MLYFGAYKFVSNEEISFSKFVSAGTPLNSMDVFFLRSLYHMRHIQKSCFGKIFKSSNGPGEVLFSFNWTKRRAYRLDSRFAEVAKFSLPLLHIFSFYNQRQFYNFICIEFAMYFFAY